MTLSDLESLNVKNKIRRLVNFETVNTPGELKAALEPLLPLFDLQTLKLILIENEISTLGINSNPSDAALKIAMNILYHHQDPNQIRTWLAESMAENFGLAI